MQHLIGPLSIVGLYVHHTSFIATHMPWTANGLMLQEPESMGDVLADNKHVCVYLIWTFLRRSL
ncbi:hypothetical protein HYPSUDRAFT_47835 [Hypholoma sublateritium FD-334 SS-4]|uniref:Uncharacterized protein n=1 Tax=Hypholoma sublateritium (strain FD-334 SS-4) TaxID=945553 RepID=A0A0D2LYP8_HYPSF|nr:hypothetical protein HYPSUDRAFT_47835 [Hypholoma sublateritium FD-334 SS-4]